MLLAQRNASYKNQCYLLSSSSSENALVPQAPPGNAHWEALPSDKTSGRAAGRPLPARTWERVSEEFCLLRQAARRYLIDAGGNAEFCRSRPNIFFYFPISRDNRFFCEHRQ
jgi:hypothetical protein